MSRPQKLQLGLIVSAIGLILTLTIHLSAYVRADQTVKDGLIRAQKDIEEFRPKVGEINVIKNDVSHISKQVDDIGNDVKILIKRGK